MQSDGIHPDFTKQPLSEDVKREHRLHKLVATSGFLFALMILPVAQYFLLGAGSGTSVEEGQVAGVSTSATDEQVTSLQNISLQESPSAQTLAECVDQKENDSANLLLFSEGKKKSMLRTYESETEQFRTALSQLDSTQSNYAEEKAALESLIEPIYQAYLSNLVQVDQAVTDAQAEIDARTCADSL